MTQRRHAWDMEKKKKKLEFERKCFEATMHAVGVWVHGWRVLGDGLNQLGV